MTKTMDMKVILFMLVSLVTLTTTTAGSAYGFGFGIGSTGSTGNGTLICNASVCDSNPWHEFGLNVDLLNIHKNTGIFHNERGVFIPWTILCSKAQSYLLQSCSDLITNGALTSAGDTAVGCITNGFILAVGAKMVNLPFGLTQSVLNNLAPMTGFGNIVDINQIPNSPDFQALLAAAAKSVNP